jgi:endonuclease III
MSARARRRSPARTGSIWLKDAATRLRTVRGACVRLRAVYGSVRLGNPKSPLDDLVYVFLSNKTTPETARRIYQKLKERFPRWDRVLASPSHTIQSIIRPAGLSAVKTRQLRAALRKINRDFGSCDLRKLKGKSESEIHAYLTSLAGVSDKVAKCVMMYTMGAHVLPVDAHVHRVAGRLGWTARKRADQCHEELESLVPPNWRYAFHVGCIVHGRKICRPEKPLCSDCCINHYCEYFKKLRQNS